MVLLFELEPTEATKYLNNEYCLLPLAYTAWAVSWINQPWYAVYTVHAIMKEFKPVHLTILDIANERADIACIPTYM